MLVSMRHTTSLLGAQAGGQTLLCSLGHWADLGCGIPPVGGCRGSSEHGMHRKAEQHSRDCRWDSWHVDQEWDVASLPQHFKLAVLIPRSSWNNREMWYLSMVSSTLCSSCLKADCIKYSMDGVGFVFALKWINLDSHTKITVLILPLMGLHMFVGNWTYFQLHAVKVGLLKGLECSSDCLFL